jgi:formylglycine-generating enzyme required for sulfatase activity
MEFVHIPAGSFYMGTQAPDCPPDDPFTERNEYEDCMNSVNKDETPRHRVTLSGFYLGKTEVTQEQWVSVMGSNPSEFKSEKVGGNSRRHPVEQVSWSDVQTFIQKLNARTGHRYRLPTEAEWEYACRAGTSGERYGNLDAIAWYDKNSGKKTRPVGQKQPNAWGLYDMLGNVRERCQDWYGNDYYSRSPGENPQGPSAGSYRVNRGGCWYDNASYVRAPYRGSYGSPSNRGRDVGFRLAMDG